MHVRPPKEPHFFSTPRKGRLIDISLTPKRVSRKKRLLTRRQREKITLILGKTSAFGHSARSHKPS